MMGLSTFLAQGRFSFSGRRRRRGSVPLAAKLRISFGQASRMSVGDFDRRRE